MSRLEAYETLVDQLATVGAAAVEGGLALASGGNLSARLPGSHDFIVTASGTWLNSLEPDDFSLMSLEGEVMAGHHRPSSEWKLHQRAYQVRPDVNAVVHVHPQHAVLVDALGYPVRLMTLDHAVYVRSIETVPFAHNGSQELADTAAEKARDCNCIILSHHGCSALGETVEMAFRRALNLEEAAVATYRSLLLNNQESKFPAQHFAELHHA